MQLLQQLTHSWACLSQQLAMQQWLTMTCCKQLLPMALAARCMLQLLLLLQISSNIRGSGQQTTHSLQEL
jgi:hypothetical protein